MLGGTQQILLQQHVWKSHPGGAGPRVNVLQVPCQATSRVSEQKSKTGEESVRRHKVGVMVCGYHLLNHFGRLSCCLSGAPVDTFTCRENEGVHGRHEAVFVVYCGDPVFPLFLSAVFS